jgi:hypothetical protein
MGYKVYNRNKILIDNQFVLAVILSTRDDCLSSVIETIYKTAKFPSYKTAKFPMWLNSLKFIFVVIFPHGS